MSGTVPHGREAGQQAEALAAAGARRSRSCDRWVAAGIVVVVAAGAVSAWLPGVVSPAASSGAGRQGALPPATAAVNATLGYARSYTVKGQGGETPTWLPSAGKVIRQRQALYETGNGSPRWCCCTAVSRHGHRARLIPAEQLGHPIARISDEPSSDIVMCETTDQEFEAAVITLGWRFPATPHATSPPQ
jgi:hypothetical protein